MLRDFVLRRGAALTPPTLRTCWQGAAAVFLLALHVVGAAGKHPGRWRCVHTCHACTPYGADVRAHLMCSQAVEGQWSSHTMDFYDWTRRGPLQLVVVHAVVQWFASFCCVWRPRSIARSTSHIACIARDVSGWFRVALEPHGLSLGDPRHRGRTGKVL